MPADDYSYHPEITSNRATNVLSAEDYHNVKYQKKLMSDGRECV